MPSLGIRKMALMEMEDLFLSKPVTAYQMKHAPQDAILKINSLDRTRSTQYPGKGIER